MCFYKYKYILMNIYVCILSVVEPLVFIICSVCLCVDHPLKLFFWIQTGSGDFPVSQTLFYISTSRGPVNLRKIKKKKKWKQTNHGQVFTVWFSCGNRDKCATARRCLLYQMASLLTWMYISVKIKWLKRNCSRFHCLCCGIDRQRSVVGGAF